MPKIITPGPDLDEDQKHCLEVLEQCIEQAKNGNIVSLAMVVCMKEGWTDIIAGRKAGDLYMGCGDLQDRILAEVKSGNVARKRSGSSIIKLHQ